MKNGDAEVVCEGGAVRNLFNLLKNPPMKNVLGKEKPKGSPDYSWDMMEDYPKWQSQIEKALQGILPKARTVNEEKGDLQALRDGGWNACRFRVKTLIKHFCQGEDGG